jgi:tryptophan-rich sensory protein
MMGIASHRIFVVSKANYSSSSTMNIILASPGLLWYGAQLLLNFAWSPLFFYFKLLKLAAVEIVVLWVAIAITMVKFQQVDYVAAALFIPYIIWVTFATVLTLTIAALN